MYIYIYIIIYIYESGLRIPGPHPPMVWSPKLTFSGTRDTGPYIHTCMHACMHPSIHPYIHTYTHADIHTYLPTYLHTYIPTYLRTYVHTYTRTYIHACMHGCIHTYIHHLIALAAETKVAAKEFLNSLISPQNSRNFPAFTCFPCLICCKTGACRDVAVSFHIRLGYDTETRMQYVFEIGLRHTHLFNMCGKDTMF